MCVSPFSSSLRQFLSTNLKLDAKSQVHVRVCSVFISWHCVTIYATPFLRYHHEEVNRKAPNINKTTAMMMIIIKKAKSLETGQLRTIIPLDNISTTNQ